MGSLNKIPRVRPTRRRRRRKDKEPMAGPGGLGAENLVQARRSRKRKESM